MKRVLILEADEDILDIVNYLLHAEGFDILSFTTIESAIGRIGIFSPLLIMLDDYLARGQRDAVSQLLSKRQNVPIALFSTEPPNRVGFKQYDLFIDKPFDADDLVYQVKQFLTTYPAT